MRGIVNSPPGTQWTVFGYSGVSSGSPAGGGVPSPSLSYLSGGEGSTGPCRSCLLAMARRYCSVTNSIMSAMACTAWGCSGARLMNEWGIPSYSFNSTVPPAFA